MEHYLRLGLGKKKKKNIIIIKIYTVYIHVYLAASNMNPYISTDTIPQCTAISFINLNIL